MRYRTAIVTLLLAGLACAAPPPRLALLFSDHGDFRHRHDYDAVSAALNWPMVAFENREIESLISRLNEFDMLIGGALFNYSNPQPLGAYHQALLEFVAQGGAVILTDMNYPQHTDWFKEFGPEWSVSLRPHDGTAFPCTWQDNRSILYRYPFNMTLSGTWMGLQAGSAWTVLARGKDDAPTALYQAQGRGFFYLSCQWPHRASMLQNLWEGLRVHRQGLIPSFPAVTSLVLGPNTLSFSARNTADQTRTLGIRVRYDHANHQQELHQAASIDPGAELTMPVTLDISQRGPYKVTTEFMIADKTVLAATALEGAIPELLTTRLTHPFPRTKPLLYLDALPSHLVFHNTLSPDPGQGVDQYAVETRLIDAGGEMSQAVLPACQSAAFDVTLPLPRAPVAPARIETMVKMGATVVQTTAIPIDLIPPRQPSVVVDDTLTLRVNGKPFFPIGIYHIGLKDLPKARDLGFNCFQGWGNTREQAQENLDAGTDNDMRVLLEMSGLLRGAFNREALGSVVREFRRHPALLTWYTVDEPDGDEQLAWAQQAYADIVELDPYHPVYLVMCSPGSFDRFGPTTDILAVDPYPIPQSVRMVSDWMQRAQDAVEACKPIWMIPQLHNWSAYQHQEGGRAPTPADLRNMTFQSLVWGAKGVIYYPWDDTVTGLIYEPQLLASIGALNAELADLGPRLLAAKRTVLATGKDQPYIAARFDTANQSLLLAVNLEETPCAMSVPAGGYRTTTARNGSAETAFTEEQFRGTLPPLAVGLWELAK